MITLATLKDASQQSVFDQIATHMMTQYTKSMAANHIECMFQTKNHLICVARCLISDDEYTNEMNGFTWDELISIDLVPIAHWELIEDMQSIHDLYYVVDWPGEMRKIAKDLGLRDSVIG